MMDRGYVVLEVIRRMPGKDATELMLFNHLRKTDSSILRDLEKAGLVEYKRGWYLTSFGDRELMTRGAPTDA